MKTEIQTEKEQRGKGAEGKSPFLPFSLSPFLLFCFLLAAFPSAAAIGQGGVVIPSGTDITTISNFTQNISNFNQALSFNGKVTLNSNVYVTSIFYKTNTMSTTAIDVSKSTQSLSTNDNLSFTGYSGIDGTNVIPFSRIFTNTAGSAAVKSITFPVGTIMLSTPFTNVVYLTNQGVFSGLIWPGFGTNGTWTGN